MLSIQSFNPNVNFKASSRSYEFLKRDIVPEKIDEYLGCTDNLTGQEILEDAGAYAYIQKERNDGSNFSRLSGREKLLKYLSLTDPELTKNVGKLVRESAKKAFSVNEQ